ncbi:MAG: serine/threonine protein kinase [Rhodospirillaceae bacterium]|nr:serine/threonine protein kinase [Rhodospirillaceae bacterium]
MADSHLNALSAGCEFEGYRIERELGAGGFGITYAARELLIGRTVAIKEYLPAVYASRATDSLAVRPNGPRNREAFDFGLKRFRKEAQALVHFRHPNIVSVYRFFEANGTAYLVMAFEEGMSLGAILKRHGPITEDEIREVLDPLLDGVALVHKSGFLHRDIKPDNVIIRRADGSPVLIDFGAARQEAGLHDVSQPIVSAGYSPFEQYASAGHQGPFSDIYALGATAYACVTGHRPTDATDRLAGARMMRAVEAGKGRYSEVLLRAIDRALAVMAEDRPQSVEEWRAMLAGAPDAVSARTITEAVEEVPPKAAPARPRGRALRFLAYGLGVVAIGAAAILGYIAVGALLGRG